MTDPRKAQLNEMLMSNGWLIVKAEFDAELARLSDLNSIDDKLPAELQIAQIKGNKEAIRIIKDVLSKLTKIAEANKISKKVML